MEKWFRKENLIMLVLAGILLVVIALPTKKSEQIADENVVREIEQMQKKEADEQDEYIAQLEKKLADILSGIKGAGNVEVMITLKESEELVVEKDMSDQKEETVYQTQDRESLPYVIKTRYPKVEGVLVVANGAGYGTVTQDITEAVQALFDIEIHKIKVIGSEE